MSEFGMKRESIERVTCASCGWTTEVQDEDMLRRGLPAKQAIKDHLPICPVLGEDIRRATELFSELVDISLKLNVDVPELARLVEPFEMVP